VSEGQIIPSHNLALGYGISHQKPTNQEMANKPPPSSNPPPTIHDPSHKTSAKKFYFILFFFSGAPFLWVVRHTMYGAPKWVDRSLLLRKKGSRNEEAFVVFNCT